MKARKKQTLLATVAYRAGVVAVSGLDKIASDLGVVDKPEIELSDYAEIMVELQEVVDTIDLRDLSPPARNYFERRILPYLSPDQHKAYRSDKE